MVVVKLVVAAVLVNVVVKVVANVVVNVIHTYAELAGLFLLFITVLVWYWYKESS